MKTSALRRWLVSLGLIALEQTTRFTGGHDLLNKNFRKIAGKNLQIEIKYVIMTKQELILVFLLFTI